MKSPERIVAERQKAAERRSEAERAAAQSQTRANQTQRWTAVREAIGPAFEALQATEWQGAGTIQVYRRGFFGYKHVKRAAHPVHQYSAPFKDTTQTKHVWLTSDRQLVVNSEAIEGDTLNYMLNGEGFAGDLPFEDVLAGLQRIAARVR